MNGKNKFYNKQWTDNLELALINSDKDGAMDDVLYCLEKGADPSMHLHQPVHKDNIEIVRLLLAHGADVNYTNNETDTRALTTAIAGEHWEIADLLLEHGADPTPNRNDALTYAAIYGHFDLVERLVNLGGEIEQHDHVMQAAARTSLETLKKCEALGGDINYDHSHLLRFSTEFASIEVMDYLIGKGQSIHQAPDKKDCLGIAAEENDLAKVQFLLSKGADPNAQVETLYWPTIMQHNDIVKVLYEAGGDPTANNDKGIFDAVFVGNTEIVKYLIAERNIPINDHTREWIAGGNDDNRKYAQQLIEKRDLFERLNQKPPRAIPTTKEKSQSHKHKI